MQLSYHGAKYTPSARTVETVETNITCQFLGKTTKLRVAKSVPTPSLQSELKYRGRCYSI